MGQRDAPQRSFEAGFPSGNPPKMFTFTAWNRTQHHTVLRAEKNQCKHINIIFTGLSRDYPGTVPGLSRPFPEISWEFCLCVSLFAQENGKHINNLTPTHFQDNRAKLFMFIGFFSPESTWNMVRDGWIRALLREQLPPFSMLKMGFCQSPGSFFLGGGGISVFQMVDGAGTTPIPIK